MKCNKLIYFKTIADLVNLGLQKHGHAYSQTKTKKIWGCWMLVASIILLKASERSQSKIFNDFMRTRHTYEGAAPGKP